MDPYKDWLDNYEREVQEALGQGSSVGPVRRALADFDAWWRTEHKELGETPSFASEQLAKELELSRKEIRMLQEEIGRLKASPEGREAAELRERLDRLGAERGQLQERAAALEKENEGLREAQHGLLGQLADLRVKTARARDEYEGQVLRLEDKNRMLSERLNALTDERRFLQTEYTRGTTRLEAVEAELKAAASARAELERERDRQALELEGLGRKLESGREERSGLERALAELRQQAAGLQDRLVRSRQDIDAELAAGRREIEALVKGGEKLEERLAERQREAEERLRDAARFLEAKIREASDENRESLVRLRDMLDRAGPAS